MVSYFIGPESFYERMVLRKTLHKITLTYFHLYITDLIPSNYVCIGIIHYLITLHFHVTINCSYIPLQVI